MKLIDILQRVQSLYSKGLNSDDSRLSYRHIYNKLLTVRSKLITNELNKKQKLSQWNYQTLPCVELVLVPPHNCPCIPPIGCNILRTKYRLPEPLMGLSKNTIKTVSTIDRNILINEIAINSIKYQSSNKYTSKKMNYFVEDGYLYITTSSKLEIITITGIFENPLEVENFKNYCNSDCVDCNKCINYLEEDFPIDLNLVDSLVEISSVELVQNFNKSIEDITNNSRDTLKEYGK